MKITYNIKERPENEGKYAEWAVDGAAPDFDLPEGFTDVQYIESGTPASRGMSELVYDEEFIIVPNFYTKSWSYNNDFASAQRAIVDGIGDMILEGQNGAMNVIKFLDEGWGKSVRDKMAKIYLNKPCGIAVKIGESIVTRVNLIGPQIRLSQEDIITFDSMDTAKAFIDELKAYLEDFGSRVLSQLTTTTEHFEVGAPIITQNGPSVMRIGQAAISMKLHELYPEVFLVGFDDIKPVEICGIGKGLVLPAPVTMDTIADAINGIKTFDVLEWNRKMVAEQQARAAQMAAQAPHPVAN